MGRRLPLALILLLAGHVPVAGASPSAPPVPYVVWACSGNSTCSFDASLSWDDASETLAFDWAVTDPEAGCPSATASGPVVWLCLGSAPRMVEMWVTDTDGQTTRWNATVAPSGLLLGVRPLNCTGLWCHVAVDVSTANAATVTLAPGALPTQACTANSHYGDAPGQAECHFEFTFPVNGTYPVVVTADDARGNVSEVRRSYEARNTPPMMGSWFTCRDGALRCRMEGWGSDLDDRNWSLTLTWEPEPGVAIEGPSLDWTFSRPGLHRVRVSVSDTHGWTASRTEIVYLRPHVWSAGPAFPAGGAPPVLASDGHTLYAVDPLPGATLASRVLQNTPTHPKPQWENVAALPIRVRDPALTVAANELYVLGGDAGSGPTSQAQVLNLGSRTWRTGVSLPVRLVGATALTDQNSVWILGGHAPTGPSNQVWRLDGGSWTELPALPWPGRIHATHHGGAVYAAGQLAAGSWELARFNAFSEQGPRWEPVPLPQGGLGDVRGMAAFQNWLWIAQAGPAWTLRSFDPSAPFGAGSEWNAPGPAPEPLAGLAAGWESLWAPALSPGPNGIRPLHVLGAPPIAFNVRAMIPPMMHEGFGRPVVTRAEAIAGTPFEEIVAVTVSADPGQGPVYERLVDLGPGQPEAATPWPTLPAGRYVVSVHGHATGYRQAQPVEVVTVWG